MRTHTHCEFRLHLCWAGATVTTAGNSQKMGMEVDLCLFTRPSNEFQVYSNLLFRSVVGRFVIGSIPYLIGEVVLFDDSFRTVMGVLVPGPITTIFHLLCGSVSEVKWNRVHRLVADIFLRGQQR